MSAESAEKLADILMKIKTNHRGSREAGIMERDATKGKAPLWVRWIFKGVE